METIAICICTYQRREMLARCILSLIQLTVLPEWNIIFIVVDNELKQNNKDAIEAFRDLTTFPIIYVHQPKRGVAAARNAALVAAEQNNSDWICFFDDDQYVKEDTLKNAMLAAKQYQAQVVKMFVQYIDSKGNASLMSNDVCEYQNIETCATNGVLFDISLIDMNRKKLRFDEKAFLMRGEDRDFFYCAFMNGAKIVKTCLAVVYEESTIERDTYWYFLTDTYFNTASSIRFYYKYKAIKKLFHLIFFSMFGLWYLVDLVRLPYFYVFNYKLFKHKHLKILHRLFCAIGVFHGLLFFLPIYKKNIGY